MGFILYLSGCALPAIGVLRALEERDETPSALIARAGGALTGGLYACGWRAEPLERLTRTLERSALALLGQLLPSLCGEAARLTPRALAGLLIGDAPFGESHCELARPLDGLDGLLCELTGGVALDEVPLRLLLPVRAYSADGRAFESDVISSGPHTRWALTLATALRCAAFPAGSVTSPGVGGRMLAACRAEDLRGTAFLREPELRRHTLVCVTRPGDCCPDWAMRIEPPLDGREPALRQIEAGYRLMRARMSELISLC